MSQPSIEKSLPPVPTRPDVVDQPLSRRDLTELLIKQYGLHEGHYELLVEFMIGSGNMGPTPETSAPSAVVSFSKVGLIKMSEPSLLSLDATVVNPVKKKRASKAL